MFKTIEVPDIEVYDDKTSDYMKITKKRDYIEFDVCIDNTGQVFKVPRSKIFMLIYKKNYKRFF